MEFLPQKDSRKISWQSKTYEGSLWDCADCPVILSSGIWLDMAMSLNQRPRVEARELVSHVVLGRSNAMEMIGVLPVLRKA